MAVSGDSAREAQLEQLINETPFMLTRCSRDLRYLFVSRAYADMLGRTRREIEGRPIVEIMGDEGLATIRPHVESVLRGTRVEFDTEINFAVVGVRALRVVYTPDTDTHGRVMGWIASILDISDERGARDARALVTSIVESSVDAIVTKNLDGIITSWNAAAQELFGYSAADMIGQPIRRLIPSERQWEEDDILARLRAGERIEHFETVRIAKGGRRLDISVTISPLRDASGTVIGASKIARDISALKAADAERLRLLEENAAVKEALNDVGAIVASDLDRDKVVQAVTEKATDLTTAEIGTFFYNVLNSAGDSYARFAVAGAPREAFSTLSISRHDVFDSVFGGAGIVASGDITRDGRHAS